MLDSSFIVGAQILIQGIRTSRFLFIWHPLTAVPSLPIFSFKLAQILTPGIRTKETPLDSASSHGKLKIVRLLLASSSSANSLDAENSTRLHRTTQNGHLDIVTPLLNSGTAAYILNSDYNHPSTWLSTTVDSTWQGLWPSEWAVWTGSSWPPCTRHHGDAMPSLRYGSEPNIPDKRQDSLHGASEEGTSRNCAVIT